MPPTGSGAADPLAGMQSSGGMGGGFGDLRAAMGAPPASALPSPGKWDEVDGPCQQVMEFQTWDGVEINYTKAANQSQTTQLLTQHGLKLGNPRSEGYSLTSTYASNALFMQGMTSSALDLQGVLVASDFLVPGMAFKFQPGFGLKSPDGEVNQATFELSYKGSDWSASAAATTGQNHGYVTFLQSLTTQWAAGLKLEGIAVTLPAPGQRPSDMLSANLQQMLCADGQGPASPYV